MFVEISPNDQWLLHDFFVPDRALSDLELLAYRDRVTTKRPSFPHQAGRALSRFWAAAAHAGLVRVRTAKAPARTGKRFRQADRHLVVKPLVRPQIDVDKLARALIWMAHERASKRNQHEDRDQAA